MNAPLRYVVIETDEDGTEHVWGPFTDKRADDATDALLRAGGYHVRSVVLHSSAALTIELPDWRRVA